MSNENIYTPIDNYMLTDCDLSNNYLNQTRALYSRIRKQKITIEKFVESKLGSYNSKFKGSEYLFKIWVGDKWRCLVSNGYGIEFDVDVNSSSEEAVILWENFLKKLK